MMVSPVVGRLGTTGWARTPEERMSALLTNYRASAYSQTTIYAGSIKSLTFSQFRAAQDPESLASLVKEDLESLYGNVFVDGVEVQSEVVYDPENIARYAIEVGVRVQENGEFYSLHDSLGHGERILEDYEREL